MFPPSHVLSALRPVVNWAQATPRNQIKVAFFHVVDFIGFCHAKYGKALFICLFWSKRICIVKGVDFGVDDGDMSRTFRADLVPTNVETKPQPLSIDTLEKLLWKNQA